MSMNFDLVDEEIFNESSPEQITAVVYWLVHLLGDKVVIPTDAEFWDEFYPANPRLVMREENGQLVLVAEDLDKI